MFHIRSTVYRCPVQYCKANKRRKARNNHCRIIVMLVNALRGAAMNLQTRKKAPRSVCMCLGVRFPGNAFPEISPHVEIQKIYLCTFVDSPDYTWYQVRSMSFKSITAVFIFLQCGVSYRALSGQFNLIPQIPCFSAVF